MLVSTKPDDRRRMAAASSSSTRNLSRMRLRERIGGSGEKRDLLKGLSELVRTVEPATSAPAEVAPKHGDFATSSTSLPHVAQMKRRSTWGGLRVGNWFRSCFGTIAAAN